jgi:hypothetical protein
MASYVLRVVTQRLNSGNTTFSQADSIHRINSTGHNVSTVLFLTHECWGPNRGFEKGDYAVDTLLHGLKELLGHSNVVDFPRRQLLYKTSNEFDHANYLKRRSALYGYGFSLGLSLEEQLNPPPIQDEGTVRRLLKEGYFDLVILGSGHRGDARLKGLDLWRDVCKYYNPSKVVVIDGGDEHMTEGILYAYHTCADHFFSREGFVPAVPLRNGDVIKSYGLDKRIFVLRNQTLQIIPNMDALEAMGVTPAKIKVIPLWQFRSFGKSRPTV